MARLRAAAIAEGSDEDSDDSDKEEVIEKEPSWKRELNENRAAAAEEAEEEEEDPFEKLARLQAEAGGETVHRVSGGDSGSTSTAPPVLFSAPTLSNVFAAPLNALKSMGSMHWGSHDELEASDEEEGDDEEASHSGEDMVLHTSSEEDEPRQPSKRAPAAHVLGAARAKRQGGGGATRVVIGPDGQKHYVPTNFISKPKAPRVTVNAPIAADVLATPARMAEKLMSLWPQKGGGNDAAAKLTASPQHLADDALVSPSKLARDRRWALKEKAKFTRDSSADDGFASFRNDSPTPKDSPPSNTLHRLGETSAPARMSERPEEEDEGFFSRTSRAVSLVTAPLDLIGSLARTQQPPSLDSINSFSIAATTGIPIDEDGEFNPNISLPTGVKHLSHPSRGKAKGGKGGHNKPKLTRDSSMDNDDARELEIVSVTPDAELPPLSDLQGDNPKESSWKAPEAKAKAKRWQSGKAKGAGGGGGGGNWFDGFTKAFANVNNLVGGGNSGPPKFDAALEEYETVTCYCCEVPLTIVQLWSALYASENGQGLCREGIFRLAPDPKEVQKAEREIISGKPIKEGQIQPEILAHLIKSFFRRLPGAGVLSGVPIQALVVVGCSESKEDCAGLLNSMRPKERSLLEWLIRLILEVNFRREENKMNLRNLCVVWAPNLRLIDALAAAGSDPVEELRNVDHVANALHALATHAFRQMRSNPEARPSRA